METYKNNIHDPRGRALPFNAFAAALYLWRVCFTAPAALGDWGGGRGGGEGRGGGYVGKNSMESGEPADLGFGLRRMEW